MALTLDRELEQLIAEEVRSGRAESAEALVNAAIREYFRTRQFNEEELAELREELRLAEADIDAGNYIELEDEEALSSFFQEVRRDALERLNRKREP